MKRIMILILAMLIIPLIARAQEPISGATPIPPPAGYMDSCNGSALMIEHFGPNCLNPVFWDLAGMPRVGTWLNFIWEDGTSGSAMLLGFSWQMFEGRYTYYVMRPLSNSIFPFAFETIAPERVTQ